MNQKQGLENVNSIQNPQAHLNISDGKERQKSAVTLT